MRTFWTDSSIQKNAEKEGIRPGDWILKKKKEFEFKTTVKWSVSSGNGGESFHPVDEGVEPVMDGLLWNAIVFEYHRSEKDLSGYVSYLTIWSGINRSLSRIMGVVKAMEKAGFVRRTVDRMGKGYAFKIV